ncbi:MAG TPA: YvcK family protein [Candidatus Moranbacteria bacterium]|nr:YvcK family protein [Candidatus Moranbacteria bacterium]
MKNIVTIGGGTGSFVLLSGLKKYPINISAIVSMADDGGSNGMLRDELGVLPPGDAKQCLLALSDCSQILRKLMNYRFSEGRLRGHSFGNLFISALEKIKKDFAKAIIEASKILSIKGEVIPAVDKSVQIHIKLKNGKVIIGENNLDHNEEIRKIGLDKIYFKKEVRAYPEAVLRIKKADFIIIGPGDHYGSILPNLIVKGISKAIRDSKAKVIYNCNITNKKGQTIGYDLDKYVSEINSFIGKDRINFVTYNSARPNKDSIELYEKLEGKNSLVLLNKNIKKRNFKIAESNLLQNKKINISKKDLYARKHSFIRHNPDKLAKVLMSIIKK